jgi:hypothetical protein
LQQLALFGLAGLKTPGHRPARSSPWLSSAGFRAIVSCGCWLRSSA